MPVGLFHRVKDRVDERLRHFFVEQVAHGVDKDAPRLTPAQRLPQALRPQRQIKAVLERMAVYPAKPLREAFRITEVATAGDLGAPGYGVPSRIRPFDLRGDCHTVL